LTPARAQGLRDHLAKTQSVNIMDGRALTS
jgi:hypothetical protein